MAADAQPPHAFARHASIRSFGGLRAGTMSFHSRIAAFYVRKLAACDGMVASFAGDEPPHRIAIDAMHVAVARDAGYAIDGAGRLWRFGAEAGPTALLDGVAYAAAGESRVLAVTNDGQLLSLRPGRSEWTCEATGVTQAWVGDSSDYYVAADGRLFVTGLAHRGQYGDGTLEAVQGWKHVADEVAFTCAHTGHAVILRRDGTVQGTGGNRFGPLGRHGFGDKADRWATLFDGAVRIASGARHTLALRIDGSVWIWGENEGLDPKRVLDDILQIAAGDDDSLALARDGRLWHWRTGAKPALVRWTG
jgi:alpha-tubulin suppressor-like RCC1 family protein